MKEYIIQKTLLNSVMTLLKKDISRGYLERKKTLQSLLVLDEHIDPTINKKPKDIVYIVTYTFLEKLKPSDLVVKWDSLDVFDIYYRESLEDELCVLGKDRSYIEYLQDTKRIYLYSRSVVRV